MNAALYPGLARKFAERFGRPHAAAAYAPGRVEVLGNHTDYNEGFVLSAAIDFGTYFLAAPSPGGACRLAAANLGEETAFDVASPAPSRDHPWANYVKGVLAGLSARSPAARGFDAMIEGDLPLAAGLSSSAALEMAAGLALCALYGLRVAPLDLARIGQKAEHEFAGAKTGLLDQISILFGRQAALVMSDFRSLAVETVPAGPEACFLMCNTRVTRALVAGEYNARRESCEAAAAFFRRALPHPVACVVRIHRCSSGDGE